MIRLAWVVVILLAPMSAGRADEVRTARGMALIGEPALPDGFHNFPWVNPDAPKGGEIVRSSVGGFDSFNQFIVRGAPAPLEGVNETLFKTNPDEPSSAYAHLAEHVELPADRSWIGFVLRPEARWQDGTPVTSEDVKWTFDTLREKGRPLYQQYYADVDHVETDGPRRVVFRFKTNKNRELGYILADGLPVLPEHWWHGRDFTAPLHEPPLGSGPYRVKSFDFGGTLVMERVPDYWGRDLPTERGLHNFDLVRIEFFRDFDVAREAFKAGQIDWRQENVSKDWATFYDFDAVRTGLVRKESFPHRLPTGMQGFVYNTRRAVFQDKRVRQALALVFDFEWMNRNLFFGLYARTESYFSNSDLASSGLPAGDELALLEPYRAKLPPEVFATPYRLPVTDGSGNNRAGLRAALELLKQAGWELRERRMVNAAGQQMRFEILLDSPAYERIALPYRQQLERLGIAVGVRTVDPAQYQRITDDFDYDMIMAVFGETESPGNEQSEFWGCAARDKPGSNNAAGVCDPVVDALVAKVTSASDRPQLLTAVRALDRVLLWGWYVVPQWHLQQSWVADWDRFGRPTAPLRSGFDLDSWWVDPARAAVTDAKRPPR